MNTRLDRIALTFWKPGHALPSLCAEWLRRREMRKAYRALSAEDLRDIGLTLQDVRAALLLPLGQCASTALAHVAQSRSGKW